MKYILFFALALIARLGAMENANWDVERMATQIGNQRRADDKILIKEFHAIAKKRYKDLTHQEESRLNDLAWHYEHSCILELLCQSPLFQEKEMGLRKDLMLYFAVQEVSAGVHNSSRRARILKNVEILLKNGAAQDEGRFESVALSHYVFESCGLTQESFKVWHITQEDHLKLIGLYAKHVKHDGFKKALEEELSSNEDYVWVSKVAEVAIENGMDSTRAVAILKQRTA